MGRIFTFGCSFTNYEWPTWADIILYGNEGYNIGVSGSGNESMLYRIMEADRKFNFTKEDQIIVMFTTPIRWDLITGTPPIFLGYGQVTNVDKVSKYNGELYTIEGLCFKSYYSILAIKNYLEHKQVNHLFGSILDIFNDVDNYFSFVETSNELKDLISYVKTDVKFDLISVHDFLAKKRYINNRIWCTSKKWEGYDDYHPRPNLYHKYVISEIMPKIPFDLKITNDIIHQIEHGIETATNMKDYMKSFNEKFPMISNKRIGSEIFYKKY
jgi:hypothetical protein